MALFSCQEERLIRAKKSATHANICSYWHSHSARDRVNVAKAATGEQISVPHPTDNQNLAGEI
jgi:hypothetical protein